MSDRAEADVDLLRQIALALEPLERSPPEPIILGLNEFSGEIGCAPRELADALEQLVDLALIEGPGGLNGAWLFRRMTPKGLVFLEEVRSQARWDQIKQAYRPGSD